MDLPGLLGQARPRALLAGLLLATVLLAACSSPAASASEEQAALPVGPGADLAAVAGITASPTMSALRPFVPTSTPTPAPTATPLPPATATAIPTITPLPTEATVAMQPPPTVVTTTAVSVPLPIVTNTNDLTATNPTTMLNGIPFEAIAVLPPDVAATVQIIYQRGQELGRNPGAFSKLGDSLVLTETYLTRFDRDAYTLGPFAHLQPVIDRYAGSFGRYGVATKVGLYAALATRPGVANSDWCSIDEHMMACEFRLHNPSVMLIRIGTNDADTSAVFEAALRKIVEYAIENGVIPVLGTKADRFEGDNRNNDVIRKLAADYRVPLWDFDLVAGTLPNRGLGDDNAHLTAYKNNDYTDPVTLQTGYPVSDLTALILLDAIRSLTTAP